MRINCSSDREKLLKFEAEGQEFCKISEITRTIYSNSERSERFFVTIIIQIGKKHWDLETCRKRLNR